MRSADMVKLRREHDITILMLIRFCSTVETIKLLTSPAYQLRIR